MKPKDRLGTSLLAELPATGSALERAHIVGQLTARVGFDWPDHRGVQAKIAEELAELNEALAEGDPAAVLHEYGDVLLAVSSLGRFFGLSPEAALQAANVRYESRFRELERVLDERGMRCEDATPDELEAAWQTAKKRLATH